MRIKKITIKHSFFFGLFIFQTTIGRYLLGNTGKMFDYLDEFFCMICLIYILNNINYRHLVGRLEKSILYVCGGLLLIGIIGSFIYHIQPLFACLIDIVACSKFCAVLVATILYMKKKRVAYDAIKNLNAIALFIPIILMGLILFNTYVVHIFPIGEYRFHIYTQQLMFGHPSTMADAAIMCMLVLIYNLDSRRYNWIGLLCASFVVISSTRTKAISTVIVVWIILFYFRKIHFKLKSLPIIICATLSFLLAYDSLKLYFGGQVVTARGEMLATGLKIAFASFPIGRGFATFGSGASVKYYSPLYYEYGLNNVWGLGGNNKNFINDSFWPVILGQFGFLGVVVLVSLFVLLVRPIWRFKSGSKEFCTGLSIILYLLIISTGTTGIFNVNLITAVILGICLYRIVYD